MQSERTYKAFYKGQELEVTASTSFAAQKKAAKLFKKLPRRDYEVTVILCDIVQSPSILG